MSGCSVVSFQSAASCSTVPAMSGLQLHKHLLQVGYTLPVIFITGPSKNAASGSLQKPFNDEQLLAIIEQALIGTRSQH